MNRRSDPGSRPGAQPHRPNDGSSLGSDESSDRQYFPETQIGWIEQRLGEGRTGQSQVNEHIMQVYYRPLQYYYLGLKGLRNLGEPDDIVNGFFADRLSRNDFMPKWRESGLKLRRWLMNGLHFYLKERIRAQSRDRNASGQVEELQVAVEPANPEGDFEREFANALVAEALKRVQDVCTKKGLDDHWDIFVRHHYHGESYKDFAHEYRVEPVRASVMARTVRDRFRATIRELLIDDGVKPNDIENEIRSLMEAMSDE